MGKFDAILRKMKNNRSHRLGTDEEYRKRFLHKIYGEEHLSRLKTQENEILKREYQLENLNLMLEKMISRALFELVDFSKI